MTCGIYKITNLITEDCYIGKSKDIRKRKYHHFFELKRGKHNSIPLQNDYNKYGKVNFSFEELIICKPYELGRYEWELITKLKPLYNTMLTGSPRRRQYLDPRTEKEGEIPGLELHYKPLKWHRWVYGAGRH